jgi:hypothetical protein
MRHWFLLAILVSAACIEPEPLDPGDDDDAQPDDPDPDAGVPPEPDPVLGQDWRLLVDNAPFGARTGSVVIDHGGELWLIAGSVSSANIFYSDVWHSTDGATWTAATGDAGFVRAPSSMCGVSFGGSMWVIQNRSVWSSSDGVQWTNVVPTAAFPQYAGFSCVVWDAEMWLLGPQGAAWSSPDGLTWTQRASCAAGGVIGAAVYGDKLYAAGSAGLYATLDGVTWTPVTLSFSARTLVVADGALWTISGANPTAFYRSTDGVNWTSLALLPPLDIPDLEPTQNNRGRAAFVAFDARLWFIGGGTGYYSSTGQFVYKYFPEVWVSP